MGKCTTEKFIEKARKRYGDKYEVEEIESFGKAITGEAGASNYILTKRK